MTARPNLERRVGEYYANEPPVRAPDRVLLGALETIDSTPQRRGILAPWRFTNMPTFGKLAAAVAVVAVVAFGIWQLAPGPGTGGQVTPTPSPSPSRTSTPTARPAPSAYVPPALTGTFTSDLYGYSISYPDGWTTDAATEPWTDPDPPQFGLPTGDFLYDPARTDHLFVAIVSRPLGGTPLDEWLADFMAAEGCTTTQAIVIDGADGLIDAECSVAFVSADGRGYFLWLYKSDDAELRAFDAAPLFEDMLATLQLHPEDAVDEAPPASP